MLAVHARLVLNLADLETADAMMELVLERWPSRILAAAVAMAATAALSL